MREPVAAGADHQRLDGIACVPLCIDLFDVAVIAGDNQQSLPEVEPAAKGEQEPLQFVKLGNSPFPVERMTRAVGVKIFEKDKTAPLDSARDNAAGLFGFEFGHVVAPFAQRAVGEIMVDRVLTADILQLQKGQVGVEVADAGDREIADNLMRQVVKKWRPECVDEER